MVPTPRCLGRMWRITLQLPLSPSSSSSSPREVVERAPMAEHKMTSLQALVASHLQNRSLVYEIVLNLLSLSPRFGGFLDVLPYQLLLSRMRNFNSAAEVLTVGVPWSFVVPLVVVMDTSTLHSNTNFQLLGVIWLLMRMHGILWWGQIWNSIPALAVVYDIGILTQALLAFPLSSVKGDPWCPPYRTIRKGKWETLYKGDGTW